MEPLASHRWRRLGALWLCLLGLLWGGAAHSQALSPEVSRGIAWLQSQVQAEGTLANEASSVATALQVRSEAAQTLKSLDTLPPVLVDAIAGESDDNTEYLARRVTALAMAGRDTSTFANALFARQNADGGFGGAPGYDSNALDTAWALVALRSANAVAQVSHALAYLRSAQAPDGSYSAPGRPDIEATAMAVLAQRLYASQFDVIETIMRAVAYLFAQQSPTQQWEDSAFLTATVYEAVHDFAPFAPAATAVRSFLLARQSAEGSWDNGDPFATALALRALVLADTPPANPVLAIIKGKVIDSQTRLGLDGVTVTLTGLATPPSVVTSGGSFEFRDLPPGSYSLQLSLSQYGGMTFTTAVPSGQTVDFGAIAMTKNTDASTGTVRGTVREASTGLPLADVLISLGSGQFTTTDAGGNYQIANVAPGSVTIVASKTGYASAPGGGNVLAGGTLIFSPSLFLATQASATAIEGTVTDGVSHAPLAGATITVTGSTQAAATTDAQGNYRIEPLNPGVMTVSVVRAGYRSLTASVTVPQNTTIQFSPRLVGPTAASAKLFVVSAQGDQSTNEVFRYQVPGPADGVVPDLTLTHPSLDRPCCLAFSATGEMFVVNRGAPSPGNVGSISRFSDPGRAPSFNGTISSAGFSAPQFASFRASELFVAQRYGDNVLRFSFDGTGNALPAGAITAGLAGNAARGVAAHPATGELFVTRCCGINEINRYVFDAAGNPVPNGVITGGGLNNPHDIAFSARGELFVANADGHSVSRFVFDAVGNALPNGEITGNGLSGPVGLDFSPWGELFVANSYGSGGVSRWLFDAALNAVPNSSFSTPATVADLQFVPGAIPGVRGIVVDARNDQPLAGVAIEARIGSTVRTLTTGLDGRFEFNGLPSGEAEFSFGLGGYLAQRLGLELSALSDLDIGPVRLQKSDVTALLPDLVVQAVDMQQVASDPESFVVGGTLTATVANQGTVATANGFRVLAFYDANRNNVYDAGIDLLLGEAQSTQTLNVGATEQVAVSLAGTLPFRDAPIKVWVDSAQAVVETNEVNNVAAAACQITPPPATINLAPLYGVASSNSFYTTGTGPQYGIDGNVNTIWNAGRWASSSNPAWLAVDLQGSYQVDAIVLDDIRGAPGAIFYGYTNVYNLYVSNDGATWLKVGSGTLYESNDPAANTHVIPLAGSASTLRYVKYEVVGGSHWAHLMDLEVLTSQQLPPTTAGDFTASMLRLTDLGSGQLRLSARIGNGGAATSPATTVVFYDGDPNQGGVPLGTVPVNSLQPGQYQDVELVGALNISGQNDLHAIVDSTSQIAECREGNNRASGTARQSATGSIAVATDAAAYGPQTQVGIAATIVNNSALPAILNAALRVEDATGVVVATFPPRTGVTLAGGASTVLNEIWNTGATLAGSYRVTAELVDGAGQPLASAFAPFGIAADTAVVSAKVTADKTFYLPSETAQIVSRAANLTDNQPLDSVTVLTTVTGPDGSVRLARSESIAQLVQGTLKDYSYALPLGFAPAGVYAIGLSVRDALGAVLATGSTSFTVLSSAATGSGLTASLGAAPKPVPFGDPIVFSATVNNLGNADMPGLGVRISVVDPAAQQVLAEFPATLNLPRQQSAPLSFAWPANAGVGSTLVAVLTATVGTATVTLAQEPFTIAPPVTRVTGTLAAIPKEVPQGEPVAFSLAVANVGFGAITGLPLTVTVTDAATQQVVAQFTDSANIALNSTYQKAFSWPVTGPVGTNYTATLAATVDGAAQTLAQDSFTVLPPPVRLDVTLERIKEARVLALVSCRSDHDHDHDGHDGDGKHGHDPRHGDGRDGGRGEGDHERDDESCSEQRGAFLNGYLTGLGITHRVTNTEADFREALRSGAYNTYWISGGAEKLEHELDNELREAVYRGDALLVDAVHDERNHGLDAILGVDVRGKLNPADQTVSLTGPLFAAGSIATAGRPLRLKLTTGQAQAVFPNEADRPAIVSNLYGLGRSLVFGFDLVGTLLAQPGSSTLDDLSRAALGWLAPDVPGTAMAGEYTLVRTRVQNLALAVEARVTLSLPAGTDLVSTMPAATVDASGRPVWTMTLDSGQKADLLAAVRAPLASGDYSVQAQLEAIRDGQVKPYDTYSLALDVTDAEAVSAEAIAALQALALPHSDRKDRDRAVAHLQSAQAKLAQERFGKAIDELLEAAEDLARITSVDVSAYRLSVDRMLQEAGYRWFLALPHCQDKRERPCSDRRR